MIVAAAMTVAYVAAYAGYRQGHVECWERDGRNYVIYDSRAAYLLFTPMRHADQRSTGTGAHLGPHR